MLKEDYTDAWKSLNLHFVQEFCFRSQPYNWCPNCKRWGIICGLIEPANTITKEEVRFCKFKSGSVFFHLSVLMTDLSMPTGLKRRCEFSKTSIFAHKLWQKNQILKDLSICESDQTEVVNLQRPPIYACQIQKKKRIPWVLIAEQKILKTLETLNFSLWNLVKKNAEEIAEFLT